MGRLFLNYFSWKGCGMFLKYCETTSRCSKRQPWDENTARWWDSRVYLGPASYFANNFDQLPAALVYSSLKAETSWGWMCTLKSYLWLQNLNCFKACLLCGTRKVVWKKNRVQNLITLTLKLIEFILIFNFISVAVNSYSSLWISVQRLLWHSLGLLKKCCIFLQRKKLENS